jgi:hypothetical protein
MGPLVLWVILGHGTFSAVGHIVAWDVFIDVGRLVMERFESGTFWAVKRLVMGGLVMGRFESGTQ